jgi:hypothetical protein
MMGNTYTWEEKIALNLPLSQEDVITLLKDPNSWLSKLYAELKAEAELEEKFFISCVLAIMNEAVKDLASREEVSQKAARVSDAFIQEMNRETQKEITAAQLQAQEQSKQHPLALEELLNVPTETMNGWTIPQIERYHNELSTHYAHEVKKQLPVVITLKTGEEISTAGIVPKPIVSAVEVLKHNPGLVKQLLRDPNMQDGFSVVHTEMATGSLSAINIGRQLMERHPEKTKTVAQRIEVFQAVAKAIMTENDVIRRLKTRMKECDKATVGSVCGAFTATKTKTKTNASLTEPPAFYATTAQANTNKPNKLKKSVAAALSTTGHRKTKTSG